MSRFGSLPVDLVARLRAASPQKQREACIAACEIALAAAKVDRIPVHQVIRALRNGNCPPLQQLQAVDRIVSELDDEYFRLQEAAETNEADPEGCKFAFVKARAVAAVAFAGGNAADFALNSVYEAAAAMGDDKLRLYSKIESALK